MRKIADTRILFSLVAIAIAWVLTGGAAYGVNVFTRSLNASVTIEGDLDFKYYRDPGATQLTAEIDLPNVSPGGTTTFTIYLKNTGTVTQTLTAGPNSVPSSVGTLTLMFNGQPQFNLKPGDVCKVVGTLTVVEGASPGELDFSISVNAVPANIASPPPTTNPPPTTQPPTTTPVLNGQLIFAENCITCHSSGTVNTSKTLAQLLTFIPTHRTGSTLTQEEVAAIASYLKP